jgi:hypothetical protein
MISAEDRNDNGYLEYPSGSGYIEFSIDFIVNSENECKLEAARKITDTLKSVGINITLLNWIGCICHRC